VVGDAPAALTFPGVRRMVSLGLVLLAPALAGCGGGAVGPPTAANHAAPRVPLVSPDAIRSPKAHSSNMDTNPANLASAVVTHAFGQLPQYIDDANFRLLPYDMFRVFEPGRSLARTVRLTTPRTSLVLDTVVTSGLTTAEARQNAGAYTVSVTLDRRLVPRIDRYWIAYRNNGPLICRIYFPGDLGSLQMAVHSLVLRPLAAGVHRVRVTVVRRSPGSPPARLVTSYRLHVLARGPSAAERAIAPEENAAKPPARTPLTLLDPRS
jgi:hypothetical protein